VRRLGLPAPGHGTNVVVMILVPPMVLVPKDHCPRSDQAPVLFGSGGCYGTTTVVSR
jgi:hypothetical protein